MSATDGGDDRDEGTEQTFLSHLIELRERLLKAVAAVLVVLLALLPFANRLYHFVAEPLINRLPADAKMVAIEVASPFFTPLRLAFFAALFLAMPVILFQAWRFVAPGLYRHEKRLAMPLLVSSVALFYIGCAFAYYLVLPNVFAFLLGITPQGVSMMTDIGRYLDFVLTLFLAFGLCFEIPVAVVIIALLGWVTPAQLSSNRPYVIFGVFVVAAILAPPDVISMIMLAIPMCLLYELGVVATRVLVHPAGGDAADGRRA
ncbi:MAG TPA: twin-arginine translocase subunit TatC [Rudaea sp.]|nr:twin-arginine translocase subunit TatC [Rudaea sp.]HSC11805.1 twin-arginine translocase subunit TatC [Rhodanobacteraceae bacterium]